MSEHNFVTKHVTILSNAIFLEPGSTSFPGAQNHYLITIMQWQFWWWFWFTGMLTIYDAFFSRFFYNRLPYLYPKVVTSYRSHGRWGDLIICFIPIGWCINILSNSHFLLRALEWQTETAPFFLRVRGKQWYWVYKMDLNNFSSIEDIPKIIGRGKKVQFQKHTKESIVILDKFSELEYVRGTKQDQLFLKINPNTNKSFLKNIPTVLRGRSGNVIGYKGYFGIAKSEHILKATSLNKSMFDEADMMLRLAKTSISVPWTGKYVPGKDYCTGANGSTCYHYWQKTIVDPEIFSKLIKLIYNHKSRGLELLWVLTYRIVLKETMAFCKRAHIAGMRPLLTPICWPFLVRSLEAFTEMDQRGVQNKVHMYLIPELSGTIGERSFFFLVGEKGYPIHRRVGLYSLMDRRFPKENKIKIGNILKVLTDYKRFHTRKIKLLSTDNLWSISQARYAFLKRNFTKINIQLSYSVNEFVLGNVPLVEFIKSTKKLNKEMVGFIKNADQASLYTAYMEYLGTYIWKVFIYRLTTVLYFGEMKKKNILMDVLYPPREGSYLSLFYNMSKSSRRHLLSEFDPCARLIHKLYWLPQYRVLEYCNKLAKVMSLTRRYWSRFEALYSTLGWVVENLRRIGIDVNYIDNVPSYQRVRRAGVNEVRSWYILQRKRSLNRWVRNNEVGYKSITLHKTPVASGKVLSFSYFYPGKYTIKEVTPNVSITIKQKKIEKTTFDAKLTSKVYSDSDNVSGLVYNRTDGSIVRVPNYGYIDRNNFKNSTGNRSTKSNGRVLNKSYPYQKRLLWVNKVLLLPTHVAITIVTNSYDVIHSWFIPGLGLKLDCVPGRSTHHTIFIEYGGYYYGQCAEVCGRRHHHMPIKIRALPFMVFSYWWRNQLREDFIKNLG